MKAPDFNTWENKLTVALLMARVIFLLLFIILTLLIPFFIHFNL